MGPDIEPPAANLSVPAETVTEPELVKTKPSSEAVAAPDFTNEPLLMKVLGALLATRLYGEVRAALKVPLLVKVMAGPEKPPRLELFQLTVPALMKLRFRPRVLMP